MSHIDPTPAQFDIFESLNRDCPVEMLNLLRFRTLVSYPDDHEFIVAGLTGAEAYWFYGKYSVPIFIRVGGSIVWRGNYEPTLVGQTENVWHTAFIAHYPSTHAFLEMVSDPDYQQAVLHRQAAVMNSRLIHWSPTSDGNTFS